jgi:alpha-L-fucosidase
MLKYFLPVIASAFFISPANAQQTNALPVPTKQQLDWHDMEFYLFMHFGPNTFTDLEWGKGTEKEELFNPKNLDCNQWCRIAKDAGAKGIIITAKHHDGFCLWPSKFSKHTVRESKWKNGKGDILKELSAACKRYGLKFGVYISPWDRNHPDYGTEKYNDIFVNMMKEIFTNYGPVWELWWDGANGEGPNGKKQVYDFAGFEKVAREISPNTVIFSDIGPDIRWCGNEKGIAGETNWNNLDTAGFKRGAGGPPQDTLNRGNVNGKFWIPAECDVSIRPGWFYHAAEDLKVKSPGELFNLYLKSVGRGANLLLNVPPDGRGLITKYDSASLLGFKMLLEKNLTDNVLKGINAKLTNIRTGTSGLGYKTEYRFGNKINVNPGTMEFVFPSPQKINCIVLKERLQDGQKIKQIDFRIERPDGSSFIDGTNTVGNKRIITFPSIEARKIIIILLSDNDTKPYPVLYKPEAYLIDDLLIEKN